MDDLELMKRALEISKKGKPSPNPYVGAVVVKDGVIIGEGFHSCCGQDHSEVEALKGIDARGATIFVTLEPCSHYGKTPPCTKAIIAAGIVEVVYAVEDPTSKVSGMEELKAAGIKIRSGVLGDDCAKQNEVFIKHSKTGMPFVVAKTAQTLDGQIATSTGKSKWISSSEARDFTHHLRDRYDAILVGINTVLIDDPHLNCRIDGGKDPLRIILDPKIETPLDAKVLRDDNAIIVAVEGADTEKKKALEKKAKVIIAGDGELIDLELLLSNLGRQGITSILVEGGSKVLGSFHKLRLIDKYITMIAPKIMGGVNTPVFGGPKIDSMGEVQELLIDEVRRLGPDVMIISYPKR